MRRNEESVRNTIKDGSYEKLPSILAFVYRSDGPDCANGGISSRRGMLELYSGDLSLAEIKLLCERAGTPFSEVLRAEVVNRQYVKAVPCIEIEKGSWTMFGGNFLYTSDCRLGEITGGYSFPIAIHDRVETGERE